MGARWRCQLPWDDKSRTRHSMSLLGLYVRYFEKGGKLTTFPSRFYSLVERSWGCICLFFEEVGRERAMHLFSVTTMKHIQRSYQTSTAHQCTRVNAYTQRARPVAQRTHTRRSFWSVDLAVNSWALLCSFPFRLVGLTSRCSSG